MAQPNEEEMQVDASAQQRQPNQLERSLGRTNRTFTANSSVSRLQPNQTQAFVEPNSGIFLQRQRGDEGCQLLEAESRAVA